MDLMRLMSWETSWSLLERDPTQESCLRGLTRDPAERNGLLKNQRGWGDLPCPNTYTPNLTVKTTRINKYINKYKYKVAI